ncbi:hypothetical protein Taro_010915 [Colocasia esculenta]|uniref:Remorin C-terminal domain-containing protein n=1 Tax=Colocasia esculenta TaxID=4460 RepID=A0A843U4E3_COLES|nr:hypothetical protein [Colocasia esculenta]
MDYERIQKPGPQGGGGGGAGGGGISPGKLRLMLLGVEKKRKEEEEFEARRCLRSEVPDVDDRCFGSVETCRDVGMVCSVPESTTQRTEMPSDHHLAKDPAVANERIPQIDVPFEAETVASSVFEFQRADRAQQHWPALVPPFCRPAPSKWDDAQKWIGSPTSNRSSKSSGPAQPKRTGGFLGHGHRQCATKVLEITEEVDTKRIDPIQLKKEVSGQRTANWVPDPYPVVDQSAKPILVLENSVADSAVCLSRHDSSTLFNVSTAFVTPPSTVRSVSMRDMGTEMTPVASQEPSRTGTPVRAMTPTRSPISSRPSSPGRIAPTSSPIHSAYPQEDSSMRVLSEKELQIKTRREIMVLGTQLGKPNIAAWAGKDEEDKNASISHETMRADQSAEGIIEIRAAAWEEAEKAKYLARGTLDLEVEVERMRACAHDKLMSKLAATRHKTEAKRAAAELRRNREAAKTDQLADYIRRTGRVPSAFSCWGWCE